MKGGWSLLPIVFFEVTVLIAASVIESQINPKLAVSHKYYNECKGLVNLIDKGKITGIATFSVQSQANDKIEKAVRDELQKKIDLEEVKKDKKTYREYSLILDSVQRKLTSNIRLLDVLSVRDNDVQNIFDNEVTPMYSELSKNAEEPPKLTWSDSYRYKNLAREITRLHQWQHGKKVKKLQEKSIFPDYTDRVILSEAVHLRRKRFPDVEFYLASCDKHFSGFRKPWDVIPKEIKKQFGISCCLPRDITPNFTKNKTSKKKSKK